MSPAPDVTPKTVALKAREDRPGLAVGICLLVFLCFAGIDTSAKWLLEAGHPVGQVVFVRYLAALIIIVAVFAPSQGSRLWRMRRPTLTLVRGAMLVFATAANFFALQYLPLTVTTSIFYISPLVVTVLAALFLQEAIGPRRIAAIAIGFLGVLIITRPWGADFHWAMLVSLIPPIAASVYNVLTRKLAGVEAPDTMQFWAAILPVIFIAPFAFTGWKWPAMGWDLFFFSAIGFFGWLGHQLFVLAHRYADASTLAPVTYIHIIYMAAASWLIFHHPPEVWTIAGAAVIVVSGVYVWMRERAAKGR
ncbi:MAG: DMT family transporter [Pseudomonadota bacterium]